MSFSDLMLFALSSNQELAQRVSHGEWDYRRSGALLKTERTKVSTLVTVGV